MNERYLYIGLSVTYSTLLAAMAYIGLRWDALSSGFASPSDNGPFFCKNLFSSGGDDDAMMITFALYVLPLALRLVRLPYPIAICEVWLFCICAIFAVLSLNLASLDCADIFYTALGIPDPVLTFSLVAMPACGVLLWCLYRKSRQEGDGPSISS